MVRPRSRREPPPPWRLSIGGWIVIGGAVLGVVSLLMPWEAYTSPNGHTDYSTYSDMFREHWPATYALLALLLGGVPLRVIGPARPNALRHSVAAVGLAVGLVVGLLYLRVILEAMIMNLDPVMAHKPTVGSYVALAASIIVLGGVLTRYVEQLLLFRSERDDDSMPSRGRRGTR